MQPKILTTLRGYSRDLFIADVLAGVTVAMVALPLSLAIAIASGAEPSKGLITAIVGGFLISLFGGSRVQIGGPTGAFIVVVFGVIQSHGYDGLVVATMLAGVTLMAAGYFRLGSLVRYVPEPVINGFTIGIAVIIATSQLGDILGLPANRIPADFLDKFPALWAASPHVDVVTLAIGVVTMVLIVVFRRAAPKYPGLLLAVAITSALVAVMDMPVDTIASRFGALPRGLPVPMLPEISVAKILELLPSALVIAFLAGVESLLSASVADRMSGGHHRPNAEILAQGIANLGSSLFGGMPATGAIARTATNIRAGGKTPVAGLVHALVLLLIVYVAAPAVGVLAMPALAGLLILTAWNMSEPDKWRAHMQAEPTDRFLLLITLVLTVLTDLTVAIGVGVALGLVLRLRKQGDTPDEWKPREK